MKPLQHAELASPLAPGAAGRNVGTPLSPLQRQVVGVALCDTLASLGEEGRAARTVRLLFGGRRSSGLADPGLEALRRLAVLARHAPGALDLDEIERMRAAGFSDRQIDEVFAIVGRAPVRPTVNVAWALLPVSILTAAGSAVFLWLCAILGDPMVAAVVLAMILLPILTKLWPSARR